jgi:hypothetical protein
VRNGEGSKYCTVKTNAAKKDNTNKATLKIVDESRKEALPKLSIMVSSFL